MSDTPPVAADPEPYAHVQSDGSPIDAGIYRVVGVEDDRVTLLRVADDHGKRVHEGELAYVDREAYTGLTHADNPDEPSLRGSAGLVVAGAVLVFLGSSPATLAAVGVDIGTGLPADVLVFVGVLGLVVGVRRVVRRRRQRS